MTKEGTLPNILCTRMSIAPYKCSIMLMTCLFLFLFFLCHFLFLCHIHLQIRLLLSSPLFLTSFIFRHSADRCKWNERQVLLGKFFYRQSPDERIAQMLAAVCSWLSLFLVLIHSFFLSLRYILENGSNLICFLKNINKCGQLCRRAEYRMFFFPNYYTYSAILLKSLLFDSFV